MRHQVHHESPITIHQPRASVGLFSQESGDVKTILVLHGEIRRRIQFELIETLVGLTPPHKSGNIPVIFLVAEGKARQVLILLP